ncbi:MAG: sigma factor [Bacillales bacterium]|nr:sigma factor [Bacillales bacterium]
MAKYKVNIVGVDTSKLKTIPCAKTIELIKKYKENRDSILFDEIVQGNLKLVLLVVNKYGKKVDNLDDLFQIGTIGLLKAIENFDLSIDVKFSTYAVPMKGK